MEEEKKEAKEAKEAKVAAKEAKEAKVYKEPTESDLFGTKCHSVEKIVVLENEYDFADVPELYRVQGKKWYKAESPSSSRHYSPHMRSFYTVWLKWNLTDNSGIPSNYKGYLII